MPCLSNPTQFDGMGMTMAWVWQFRSLSYDCFDYRTNWLITHEKGAVHILRNAERGEGGVSSSVINAFFTYISQSEFWPNRTIGPNTVYRQVILVLRNMWTAPNGKNLGPVPILWPQNLVCFLARMARQSTVAIYTACQSTRILSASESQNYDGSG